MPAATSVWFIHDALLQGPHLTKYILWTRQSDGAIKVVIENSILRAGISENHRAAPPSIKIAGGSAVDAAPSALRDAAPPP